MNVFSAEFVSNFTGSTGGGQQNTFALKVPYFLERAPQVLIKTSNLEGGANSRVVPKHLIFSRNTRIQSKIFYQINCDTHAFISDPFIPPCMGHFKNIFSRGCFFEGGVLSSKYGNGKETK